MVEEYWSRVSGGYGEKMDISLIGNTIFIFEETCPTHQICPMGMHWVILYGQAHNLKIYNSGYGAIQMTQEACWQTVWEKGSAMLQIQWHCHGPTKTPYDLDSVVNTQVLWSSECHRGTESCIVSTWLLDWLHKELGKKKKKVYTYTHTCRNDRDDLGYSCWKLFNHSLNNIFFSFLCTLLFDIHFKRKINCYAKTKAVILNPLNIATLVCQVSDH